MRTQGERRLRGSRGPLCGFLHFLVSKAREGDPRNGTEGHGSAVNAPARGFPTSGCFSLGVAGLAANLPGSWAPEPPCVSTLDKTLPRTQAGPQVPPAANLLAGDHALSEALEQGTPPQPLSYISESPELRFLSSSGTSSENPRGAGRTPRRTGGKEGSCLVLPARNRFIRDLLPFCLLQPGLGNSENVPPPTLMPTGIHNFPPHFPSPRPKPPRVQTGRSLKVSWSLTLPAGTEPLHVKDQPFASASGDGSCLLGLLNVRNQTTLIVYCCKRTTLVRNGKSGWQLLTSAPIKG